MKKVAFAAVLIVVSPLVLVGGAIAAIAIVNEVLAGWLGIGNLFDFSDISLLDWLAGGPGAVAGSGVRYVAFMVGGLVAALGASIVKVAWEWMRDDPVLNASIVAEFEQRAWYRGPSETNVYTLIPELSTKYGVAVAKVREIVRDTEHRIRVTSGRRGE